MKYTAINVGPIIKTLSMARKPRELWAASYLFSYLMKCIVEQIPKKQLLSPAKIDAEDSNKGVGLYPDRVFAFDIEADKIIEEAKKNFFEGLNVDKAIWNYFNIMYVDYFPKKENENESVAVKELNNRLNILELCNYATESGSIKVARGLLDVEKSALLHKFFNSNEYETLGEIAAKELKSIVSKEDWDSFVNALKNNDKESWKIFKDDLKSYHKYICVVQADGDNVGKTVSHPELPNDKVNEISEALLSFGKNAAENIKSYGGLPIYAGGDDLLFIAPVVGADHTNIFQLLEKLNNESFNRVKSLVDDLHLKVDGREIHASLSFGVSISYYKYPLYEALASARNLLDEIAKDKYDTGNLKGKNAIAIKLQKHSGSGFDIAFSKVSDFDNPFWKSLKNLIDNTSDGNTVSAVAHKIRNNYFLTKKVLESKNALRLDAMFDKVLECTGTPYFDAVKQIMPDVYYGILDHSICVEKLKNESKDDYEQSKYGYALYNILRIAKFIKGEEAKDE